MSSLCKLPALHWPRQVQEPMMLKHSWILMEQWALQTRENVTNTRRVRRREQGTDLADLVAALASQRPPARPQGLGENAYGSNLLQATARLSLETARGLRQLRAAVIRTITIPDNSPAGIAVRRLAESEHQSGSDDIAITWAQLVLAILSIPTADLPVTLSDPLRAHAAAMVRPASLRESVHECAVYRTYSGDATIARLSADACLQTELLHISRALVASGGQLRLGPAPRSAGERAVAAAMTQGRSSRPRR